MLTAVASSLHSHTPLVFYPASTQSSACDTNVTVSFLLERDLIVSPHHVQCTRSKPLHVAYKSSHSLSRSPHFMPFSFTNCGGCLDTSEFFMSPHHSYAAAFVGKSLQCPHPFYFVSYEFALEFLLTAFPDCTHSPGLVSCSFFPYHCTRFCDNPHHFVWT